MLQLVTADLAGCATAEFLKAILALLSFPDSYTCKKGIALSNMLLNRCVSHRHLIPFVAKDIFRAALMVLVQSDKWLVGLEWEIAELLQDIYCRMVLGLCEASDRKKHMEGVDAAPRNVLLGIGTPITEINSLETQLRGVSSKKKEARLLQGFCQQFLA